MIDNQDQDRQGDIWSFNAGYQFRTDMQAFVNYAPYKVKYDEISTADMIVPATGTPSMAV